MGTQSLVDDSIQIASVDVILFNIEDDIDSPVKFEDIVGFASQTQIKTAYNEEESECYINLSVKIEAVSEAKETLSLKGAMVVDFTFEVEGISTYLEDENDEKILNKKLALALISISYATMRGIALTKFQGTMLHEAILPVISDFELSNFLEKEPAT